MSLEIQEMPRARESRLAIEKLYIGMRHLFNRGYYKPRGESGRAITNALLTLSPEIYGALEDHTKVDLAGLVYVIERLPKGITECRYIKLISEEGYYSSHFEVIIPAKRRRNCYRVDQDQMLIEVTRGRSEIYDIITHLTFLYIEAEKIKDYAFDYKRNPTKEWLKLEAIVNGEDKVNGKKLEIAISYLSSLLGSTFEETKNAYDRLKVNHEQNNGLFHIVYWMGKLSWEEEVNQVDREVSFSPTLRSRVGQHIYGEKWSNQIKQLLLANNLEKRPIHIISANLHGIMNSLYAKEALKKTHRKLSLIELVKELSKNKNEDLRKQVEEFAEGKGMIMLDDASGTNISVQIFDLSKLNLSSLTSEITYNKNYLEKEKPLIILMDYAFGEQAYETMDELLKPYYGEKKSFSMNVESISIMGKAGILKGSKGDLMIPTSHIFEGTADNYPLENNLKKEDFQDSGIRVCEGPMITVLGTSLQNKEVLSYFLDSSWNAVGLEMEGAHYQKAIQAQSMIRKNIHQNVVLRYAYYASDNPLKTGSTLASGGLGFTGVRPTYLITLKILNQILTS